MTTPDDGSHGGADAAADDTEVPGLAGERTDLAWSRSGLALAVCAAVVVREVLVRVDSPSGRVVVLTFVTLGGLAWAASLWHARAVTRATMEGRLVADPTALRRAARGTALLAAVAAVVAVIPRP